MNKVEKFENKNRIIDFVTTFYKKWSSAGRNLTRFQIMNKNWLELNVNVFSGYYNY